MTFHQAAVNGLRGLPDWQQTAILFVAVLVLGYFVIKFGEKLIDRAMYKSPHVDDTLARFIDKLTNVVGWVFLVVILLSILGIDTAAMLGGLAIGGFVIGFALKDTLGNLAAGVMLLFYRPFNVGDTVTISGESGDVIELGMSLTTIQAGDGRIITMPNGNVLGSSITNHTRLPIRRADVVVGISYDDDIDTAVKAILEALPKDPRVLADPAPSVRITELAGSSVNLQVRPWVNTKDFWAAKADFHALIKRALADAGCNIPYPQMDVHVHD